jgi:hypothetical protein
MFDLVHVQVMQATALELASTVMTADDIYKLQVENKLNMLDKRTESIEKKLDALLANASKWR